MSPVTADLIAYHDMTQTTPSNTLEIMRATHNLELFPLLRSLRVTRLPRLHSKGSLESSCNMELQDDVEMEEGSSPPALRPPSRSRSDDAAQRPTEEVSGHRSAVFFKVC